MQSSGELTVQVVLIGYVDHRVNMGAPFGFAMKVGDQIVVHHRTDIAESHLPKIFEFTAKNLPAIILKACEESNPKGKSLHEFLLSTTFHGVGSFRCWQPIEEKCSFADFDGFVLAIQNLVDDAMRSYRKQLSTFEESCTPRWDRLPNIRHAPAMPALEACLTN